MSNYEYICLTDGWKTVDHAKTNMIGNSCLVYSCLLMSRCKLTHVVSSAILAPDGQRFMPSPMPQVSFAPMHLISACRQLWTLWTLQIGYVGKWQENPLIFWLTMSFKIKTAIAKGPHFQTLRMLGHSHHSHTLGCGPLACMVALSHAETLCPSLTDIRAYLLYFQIISFQSQWCHYMPLPATRHSLRFELSLVVQIGQHATLVSSGINNLDTKSLPWRPRDLVSWVFFTLQIVRW